MFLSTKKDILLVDPYHGIAMAAQKAVSSIET